MNKQQDSESVYLFNKLLVPKLFCLGKKAMLSCQSLGEHFCHVRSVEAATLHFTLLAEQITNGAGMVLILHACTSLVHISLLGNAVICSFPPLPGCRRDFPLFCQALMHLTHQIHVSLCEVVGSCLFMAD